MPTTCYCVFQNLVEALSLQEFPCGLGTWRNLKEQYADSQYSVTTKDYGAQHEKIETLQEYLRSGPWDVDTRWSNEAAVLRNISVSKPWKLLNEPGKKFIHQFFKSLRIIDKQVSEIDADMLLLKNLENLTLSVNLLRDVPSEHLPRKLKVLELCNNCICSIASLCKDPPPLEHLGLAHNMLHDPDEYKFLTVEYWPHLLSLDLSFNNLVSLVALTDRLASLPNLRNLVLQGNPLSLIPGYRGYTIDALRDLIILDDVHISADEKHHFKGLGRKKELILEEAQLQVTLETLTGPPMPEEMKESHEADQFPIVTTQYLICYDMLADESSQPPGGDGMEEFGMTDHQPHLVADRQTITEVQTSGKEWEEEINIGYSKLHIIDDLVKFKDFLLHGVPLKVMSKTTKSWPLDAPGNTVSATPERKKSGKRDTPTKKMKEAKTPIKSPKSARKDKGKKKPLMEHAMELRSDPPIFTEIGAHLISTNFFLEGDSLVNETLHCGGGPMMTDEEREKLIEEHLQLQMEEIKPDSKQSNKKGRTPSPKSKKPGSSKKSGSGKKKDKKADQEEKPEIQDLLPPKPITLQVKIELKRWRTAHDSLQG